MALGAVALATLGTLALESLFIRIPFALFFAAVTVTARYAGLGPALAASLVSVIVVDLAVFEPLFTFSPLSIENAAVLVVLALVAALISSVTARLRSARVTERRQREWLQTTLASIGDAVIATNGQGQVVLMNAVAQNLTGWSEAEGTGRPLAEVFRIFDEQTQTPAEDPVARVLRVGAVVGLTNHTVLRARDGSERPIDDSAAPIRSVDGTVAGVVLVFRDVAERLRAEAALGESDQRLRLASSAARIGHFEIDWVARTRRWSDDLRAMLAVPADLDINQDTGLIDRIVLPEHRGRYRARLAEALDPGGTGELEDEHEVERLDGTRAWMLVRARTFFESGPGGTRAARTVGLMMDVTERKRADAALRESEERLRAVWESAADAMALTDPEGIVVAANPAYYELMGYGPEQIIGESFAVIFPPEQRPEAVEQYRQVFESLDRVPLFEAMIQRGDGTMVPIESRYDFVMQDGRRTAMVSMARDISERRALERLQQEFISMVGHELRNPLTSLRGHAQLMKRRQAYSERSVDAIIQQAGRLERLIRDLTDVSRLESGRLALEPAPMDLVDLAYACAEQVRGQEDGRVIRVEGPDAPIVGTWDRDRLAEVLTNLLSNAMKYSPDGGEIVVRVDGDASGARVAVRDHGLGIPAAQVPYVFDRFYRVRETARGTAGLGLGLSICKYLIEAHGGRIWAESDGPGQGSTVSFTLPPVAPVSSPAGSAAPS